MALKPFNVAGGLSVGETASNVIAANGAVTTSSLTVNGNTITNIGTVAQVNLDGNVSNVLSGAGTFISVGGGGTVSNVTGNGSALGFALGGTVTTAGNITLTGPNVTELRTTLGIGNVANSNLNGNANTVLLGDGTFGAVPATAGVTSIASGGGITVSANTGAVTLGSTATSAGTANAIVARDANGDFSANVVRVGSLESVGLILAGNLAANVFSNVDATGFGKFHQGVGVGNATSNSIGNVSAYGYGLFHSGVEVGNLAANVFSNVDASGFGKFHSGVGVGNAASNTIGNVSAYGYGLFHSGVNVGNLASNTFSNVSVSGYGLFHEGVNVGNLAANVFGNVGASGYGKFHQGVNVGNATSNSIGNVDVHGSLNSAFGIVANGVINLTGASNVSLGAVGNVKITGGSSGQFLQTDGSGTLSFASVSTTSISNGTSNVVVDASGPVRVSTNGTANVVSINTAGVTILGNLTVQGTTTTIDSNVVTINDKAITLANNAANTTAADGSGFEIGASNLASFLYRSGTDAFVSSKPLEVASTTINGATLTTTAVTAGQIVASVPATAGTAVEFVLKASDTTGSKYSVSTILAVTDGTTADSTVFGTVLMGTTPGQVSVDFSGGIIRLLVTPSSTNSTVWRTQYRYI